MVEFLLAVHEGSRTSEAQKPGMVVYACNINTHEVGAEDQKLYVLNYKFDASLEYMIFCPFSSQGC